MNYPVSRAFGLLFLAVWLSTSGCQTCKKSLQMQASGQGWTNLNGQAVWKSGKNRPELSGELIVAYNQDASFVFDFEKTPLPIVAGFSTSTNWQIEFPARQYRFSGSHPPPKRFLWLYLGMAIQEAPLPEPLRFDRKSDGSWRLENTKTGEYIEGFLSP